MDLSIPTVDLEDIASNEPARVERASDAIQEALGTYGLIDLHHHDVDAAKLSRLYDAFRAFVARPGEAKRPYGRAVFWFQRG